MTSPADASEWDDAQHVLALLRDGNIDAAIDAGLMQLSDASLEALDSAGRDTILSARQRLDAAWQARARFHTRQARLARIALERAARRSQPAPDATVKPALPPAAASALARALAKASGSRKP